MCMYRQGNFTVPALPQPNVLMRCDEAPAEAQLVAPVESRSWHILANDRGIIRETYPDVVRASFFDAELITSRKRTRQLGDLFSVWKNSILNNLLDPELLDSEPDL